MKYLIIGASSGLGKELAYKFAEKNHNIILVSRDERDLNALKSDIQNKYKNEVEVLSLDLSSNEELDKNLLNEKYFKEVDGVLFPIGMMLDDDDENLQFEKINKLMNSNFVSISYIISNFLNHLNSKNGLVVGFGSISGYLGRKINPYYSSSKRALESYFESLAFINKNNNLKIQFYILGYLDTNLAFGKKLKLPKGSPKKLADIVYKNRDQKFKKIYFPFWWSSIAFLLKIIPLKFFLILDKILR